MHKITLNIKAITVFAIFMVSLLFYGNASELDDISGRWVMTEVVYDDGSSINWKPVILLIYMRTR